MSIIVALADLAEVLGRYGPAYLLSVDGESRPRVLAVGPRWDDGAIVVGGIGRSTSVNIAARPEITLLWPPFGEEEHTLIVDGVAALDDELHVATVTPGSAILHVRRET